MIRKLRFLLGVGAVLCASLVLAACGGGDDEDTGSSGTETSSGGSATTAWPAVDVDLGGGQSVKFEKGEEPRFVYFSFGADRYINAIEKGAQEEADALGVSLDVLDAAVDPAKQVNQMRDAMQSGKYAGGFVTPVVESQLCNIGTKEMPEAGMMLAVTNSPLCGRTKNDGIEAWAPGSLAFIGGTQFQSTFAAWAEEIRRENPGPQKVIVVVGPELNSQSENAVQAFHDIEEKEPEFEVVADLHTDFSTPEALQQTQDALQANPDTTIIATIFSALTKGAVVALQQAGDEDVKVYDVGADSTVLPLIESGAVQMTYPYYPETMGRTAIQALYNARMGKPFERVYENDGQAVEELRAPGAPLLFVTKDNLAEWEESGLIQY